MHYLIHDFAGHPFQLQLSRRFAQQGHRVTHAYPEGLPGPKGRVGKCAADPETLEIVAVPLSGSFRKYSPVRRFATQRKYARDLKTLIRASAPDVVLSGNAPIDVQAELLWFCRKRNIIFVHWVQDVYCRAIEFFFHRRLGRMAKVVSAPFVRFERMVTAASDAVIVIAPAFQQLMSDWRITESHVTVIENWAPLDEVPQVGRDNAWRKERQLGDKPVLLYSGTLGLKHRPDLIYRLAQELQDTCDVVVLTDGYGRKYLEERPKLKSLTILGFQPYEKVPEVLASADVLLATLESDAGQFAVPSKILTYLCAGRPILLAGPKSNLASSVIDRSKAGIVVDPDDSAAWITAAKRLVADASLRAELGANGRRYAESAFNIERIAADFERVFLTARRKLSPTPSVSAIPVKSEN